MENKSLGIIGLVLVGIYLIISILYYNNALSFLGDAFSPESIAMSLLFVAGGCWMISNDEHVIFAYADFVVAIMYIIFAIGICFIPTETYRELLDVIIYVHMAVNLFLILNLPLLIRTQSQLHKSIKLVTELLIVLLVIVALTSKNSSSLLLGFSSTDNNLLKYGLLVVECLLIANPMIAIVSSDGLGGAKSKTPKLVARNQATDPNMAHTSTIQTEGINYGGMPVPDGVVANQNFNAIPNNNLDQYVSPEVANTTSESVAVTNTQPVAQEVVETPVVNEPVVANPTQPVPTNTMNSDDVAAELQSLTNNNQ